MQGCRSSPETPGERGFILIGTIWLLVLAGSIAAVLMLRSLGAATEAAAGAEALQRKLALESATETVLADHLFNDIRGRWWLLPATGQVTVGGQNVNVRITSESGRLDVNEADPRLIDNALRAMGIDARNRDPIINRLIERRSMRQPIATFAALRSLLAAGPASHPCIINNLTFVSGRPEPRPSHMSPLLSRALASPATAPASAREAAEPGAALRIEAMTPEGASLMTVARIGAGSLPLSVAAREISPQRCNR